MKSFVIHITNTHTYIHTHTHTHTNTNTHTHTEHKHTYAHTTANLPQIGRSSGHMQRRAYNNVHTTKSHFTLTNIHLVPVVILNSISKCFKFVLCYLYGAVDFLHRRI